MKRNGKLVLFTLVLVVITTACKFFFGPDLDWSGFSPVIAIALFAGMIIKEKNASFLLPLLALIISDLLIQVLFLIDLFPYAGFYSGQLINYSILMLATLIGWLLKGKTLASIFIGAIAAPTAFFIVSNISVWLGVEGAYSKDFNGLITSFTAGLPFYRNALIATLLFFPAIVFLYNYVMQRKAGLVIA